MIVHVAINICVGDLSKVELDMKKTFVETFKKCDEDFLKCGAKQYVSCRC